jgi:fructokinase
MRIGIDLGGSKTEAVALGDDGTELARERVITPQGKYQETVHSIAALVTGLESRLGHRATVGVGIPGTLSPTSGRVKNANSTWLNGQPLDRDLEAALGRPVRIANDANCFAVSEAVDGAAAGARLVFGVILGTGVGGGLAVDGRALVGANAIAGEWGHNPLPWPGGAERPGPPCYCGLSGCVETFLSGPGLARDHAATTGEDRSAAEIAAAAEAGAPGAAASLDRYVDRCARALATVVNVFDPDAIVLGGGLSSITRLYRDLPARLLDFAFSPDLATRILPPRHGDSSGVRGAAWLWPAADEGG